MKFSTFAAASHRGRPWLAAAVSALVLTTVSPPSVLASERMGAPTGLMCDLLATPALTVISNPHPRFSWIVNDYRRGAVQSAYRIVVASTKDAAVRGTGDGWDSGRVGSAQSTGVEYRGVELKSGVSYWWSVRTWDAAGVAADWSEPQEFRTGRLADDPASRVALLQAGADDFSNRYPLEHTLVRPVRVVKREDGTWFVDFGRAAYGTLLVTTDNATAGTMEVRLGEVAGKAPDSINAKPGGSRRFRSIVHPYESGHATSAVVVPPNKVRSRAGRLPAGEPEVLPFRYVELLGYPGELDATKVVQRTLHYHFDDTAAAFHSSDPTLNTVWELCRYTMKATSAFGVYIDGDRERTAYEADAYINQLGHYGCDREYTLARYSAEHLLHYATWPLEWQHHDIFIAWADYLYTGDDRFLQANYDLLARKTLCSLARADGLLEVTATAQSPEFVQRLNLKVPVKIVVDWPMGERDSHQITSVDAVANAFYYRSLVLMGRIATALGKTADATQWEAQARRVQNAYQAVFFAPERGLYRDGENVDHSSAHANLFPLAFDLVPASQRDRVRAYVGSKGMACSVYAAQYLLEALYRSGDDAAALALLTSHEKRSWYNMLRAGSTIAMEAWDDAFKPNQDWNHAWGAAPANLIPRWLMGVRPLEPGFAKFIIEPRLGSLSEAHLRTPSIRGQIAVDVVQSEASWRMTATVPANTEAIISVPTGAPQSITESGVPLTAATGVRSWTIAQGRTRIVVGGGTYAFVIRHSKP